MIFICTIYIIAISISTIYIVYIYIFFFNLHLWKLSEASDSDQSHGCPNSQWLSLVSLFLRTRACCVTLMPTLETMPRIT